MKIIEWIKGKKVGTDGYELEEFEKPDGGDVEEKVKRKVIYTGPLSTVGVSTPLSGGEKFSNWDIIEVDFNMDSDTTTFFTVPAMKDFLTLDSIKTFNSPTAWLIFNKLSDTNFELNSKTVPAGNIQRIIGIKL